MSWFGRLVHSSLVLPVERDHWEPDHAFRRRRIVAGVTLAVGATLLGLSLAVRPGDPVFYALTVGLAVTWVVGAFLSGPLHAGWIQGRPGCTARSSSRSRWAWSRSRCSPSARCWSRRCRC